MLLKDSLFECVFSLLDVVGIHLGVSVKKKFIKIIYEIFFIQILRHFYEKYFWGTIQSEGKN